MGRILVAEPSAEVRALITRVISRVGHEPLLFPEEPGDGTPDVDAVVLEPALGSARARVEKLLADRPDLPVICVSIYPRDGTTSSLAPVAYLLKPFRLGELERAVVEAVRGRVTP